MKRFRVYSYMLFFAILLTPVIVISMIRSVDVWGEAEHIVNKIAKTSFPDNQFIITDFGAQSGGEIVCTEAINKAINTCSECGGGIVLVPEGVFLTGPIVLRSNVNLHISEGSTLKFVTDPEYYLPPVLTRWEGVDCYNYSPLIYSYQASNIAITGKGILDGQANENNWWIWKGKKEFGWKSGMKSQLDESGRPSLMRFEEENTPIDRRIMGPESYLRPPLIQFYDCSTVLLEDVTILNSPFWTIHPLLSENIIIKGIRVMSRGPNTDGCNPESCKNVLIENCFFTTGDDCIAIKSGRNNDGRRWNIPSENIFVRGCTMENGHGGVVIGSEISGGCRNIFIEKCEMNSPDLERAIRIKTNSYRGGVIENIYVRDLNIGQVKEAVIKVNCMYEIKDGNAGSFIPVIKNIIMTNIHSENSKYALFLEGIENEMTIQNVVIENCNFNGVSNENRLINVSGINLKNVWINGDLVEL